MVYETIPSRNSNHVTSTVEPTRDTSMILKFSKETYHFVGDNNIGEIINR